MSPFYHLCEQAGLVLSINGSYPNVLKVEPSQFRRELSRLMQQSQQQPRRHTPNDPDTDMEIIGGDSPVEDFVLGFQDFLDSSPDCLQLCLMPLQSPGQQSHHPSTSGSTESLIRVLLAVDPIQSSILEGLLDRITTYLGDEQEGTSIPKLIMQQLKWLDNIMEPAKLSAKLLEVINMSPTNTQIDMIVSVPEIVPDSEHGTVAAGFTELLESSSELMVPILDALSNLNISPDLLEKVTEQVTERLESAELENLPVVIKFLLHTVAPTSVEQMIGKIRNKVDFRSIHDLQKRMPGVKSGAQTPEVLIIDALKMGIRFQKFVTDSWYKTIAGLDSHLKHKVIDVLVLFILHSIVNMKKKVETLVRTKIIEGHLTKKLLETTILVHGPSLREYFPVILSLAENLLRSSQNAPIVARISCSIYTVAFQVSDAYYRQEIVGSLLVHIGSGSAVEVDSSLSVLQNFVEASRQALNEYSAFIKGVLDYIDNLSLEQIRVFFLVLGYLAREDEVSGRTASLLSDLNIMIRKQLSNPTEKYKKMGVMGAIALIQAFGSKDSDQNRRNAGGSSSSSSQIARSVDSDPLLKISMSYLKMINDSCQKSGTCLSLTYDELANMMAGRVLDSRLEMWINDAISEQFTATFVCEHDAEFVLDPQKNVPMERWMNLDGPDCELSIKIMPSLCADYTTTSTPRDTIDTPNSALYICSLFKLMQAAQRATNENGIDDINGLLGCSITMIERDCLDEASNLYSIEINHTIVQSLLVAINWFRELVNAFAVDADDQTMCRVILRLQDITALEEMMRDMLREVPKFRPLEIANVHSSNNNNHNSSSGGSSNNSSNNTIYHGSQLVIANGVTLTTNSKGKDVVRGKQVASRSTTTPSNIPMFASTKQSSHTGTSGSASASGTPMAGSQAEFNTFESLTPFLRELEVDVFQVMCVRDRVLVRDILDMTASNAQGERVKLQYPELCFLLKDLLAKVIFKLQPSGTGSGGTTALPFGRKPAVDASLGGGSAGGSGSGVGGHGQGGSGSSSSSQASRFPLLARKSPADFVRQLFKILPHLVAKISTMVTELRENEREEVSDFDELLAIECLTLGLQILQGVLSWGDLKGSDHKELRLDLLKSLAISSDETFMTRADYQKILESKNLSAVGVRAFDHLSRWSEHLVRFSTAVLLLDVLNKILDLGPNYQQTSSKISLIAERVLAESWPLGTNPIKAESLSKVLMIQISKSPEGLTLIKDYASVVLPAFLEGEDCSTDYPLLNPQTFTVYTKLLLTQLTSMASDFIGTDFETTDSALHFISDLSLCFQLLASFVKSNDKREVIALTLRYSKLFMEQFIKQCLPFLGHHFRGHQTLIANIFKKNLQPATRSLQNVCGHAKESQEKSLMVLVPGLKKTMEMLIFQVKLMLEKNGARTAFWVGNLKHRNLAGEEIGSQLPIQRNSSDDDDDDEQEEEEVDDGDDDADGDGGRTVSKTKKRRRDTPMAAPKVERDLKKGQKRKRTKASLGVAWAKANARLEAAEAAISAAAAGDGGGGNGGGREPRIHSRSQVTNSDMEDDDDLRNHRPAVEGQEVEEEEEQDELMESGAEEQDEEEEEEETVRKQRRRQRRQERKHRTKKRSVY